MTDGTIDDDTIERLQAAKPEDADIDEFVNQVVDVYDVVLVEAYRDIGIDPLADREDRPDE